MLSMTGFGRAEDEADGVRISIELKSVNARYLDIMVNLPPSLSVLENRIRNHLQQVFQRGRLELHLCIRQETDNLRITVDEDMATAWIRAFERLQTLLNQSEHLSPSLLAQQEGVFKMEQTMDPETYWPLVESLLKSVENQVAADREREGLRLFQDIEIQLTFLEEVVSQIAVAVPQIKTELEESMRMRFLEILGDEANESRILTEIAAWIIKADINEEIVRLTSHIDAFRQESTAVGTKGKKLDFLCQEMAREINTIGSKIARKEVSYQVIKMKDAVEKIREQLRNVE